MAPRVLSEAGAGHDTGGLIADAGLLYHAIALLLHPRLSAGLFMLAGGSLYAGDMASFLVSTQRCSD